jgi:hypothetical protein
MSRAWGNSLTFALGKRERFWHALWRHAEYALLE